MTRFVLDPGAFSSLVSKKLVVAEEHRLVAPVLVRSEVLNALYEAVQAGKLSEPTARERLQRFNKLKVRYLGDAVLRERAWRLAAEHGWPSTLRAEYVALTQLQGDALVTTDRAWARQLKGIVPTAKLQALSEA